jgi:hypothetical protein
MSPPLPYREGDWFGVPLPELERYAVGRVARMNGEGTVLGYFFGPPRRDLPTGDELAHLAPTDALAVCLFGDLSLLSGNWPVLERSGAWDRNAWPVPVFGVQHDIVGIGLRVEIDEQDLTSAVREERVSMDEAGSLPSLGLLGDEAVEAYLAHLLATG